MRSRALACGVLFVAVQHSACAIRRPPPEQGESGGSTGGEGAQETLETSTSAAAEEGTGAEESSGSEGAGSEEQDSQGFVPDTPTTPEDGCEPAASDCPEGEKCVWYVAPQSGLRRDAAKCIPVTGEGEPFDPCTLPNGIGPEISDDCGADSYCLDVYGTADHGFCAPYLQWADAQLCQDYPGTSSAVENGSDFPAACLHFECQPLLEDSCPPDMRCTFYPAYLYGSMFCWRVPEQQSLPLGAPCDFGQCGEGKLCAPTDWLPACEGQRCCTTFCDLEQPSCELEGTSCEFFPVNNFEGKEGFETLGACVLEGSLGG